MDPADRVRVAELDLIAPLDEIAGRLVAVRARRVMLLTAIAPTAVLDIAFVAVQNMKMLREVATLYGGRPGIVGTLRLARMVVAHLAAAGALAMSDQLVQQIVGQGILGRLSARFGEGAVNGIITARIGLAAIDVCRPLPFTATSRPGLAQFLTDVMRMGEANPAPAGDRPNDRRAQDSPLPPPACCAYSRTSSGIRAMGFNIRILPAAGIWLLLAAPAAAESLDRSAFDFQSLKQRFESEDAQRRADGLVLERLRNQKGESQRPPVARRRRHPPRPL
jgi:hypothetical protein